MKGLVKENKSVSLQNNLVVPSPQENEVLVKVKYSSIHSFDLENIEGKNELIGKLMGAKKFPVQTGIEFSGIVETTGKRFKKGDKVFGYPDLVKGLKAHQEFLTIHEDLLALMPSTLDFMESAAIPVGALTVLAALEDIGKISKQSKVLVNGAAGGLGVYAVQIAKAVFEAANVTAIAGPEQTSFLKGLGADKVINYKERKIETINDKYDILLDLTARVSFSTIKKLLTPNGVFIPADPFTHLLPIMGNVFRSKKVGYLLVAKGNYENLTRIAHWVEQGKLRPIIDSVYAFEDYEKGFERTLEKGKRGRVILQINS